MAGLGAGSHIQVHRFAQREQGYCDRARATPRGQAGCWFRVDHGIRDTEEREHNPAVSSKLAQARHVPSAGGNPKSAQ